MQATSRQIGDYLRQNGNIVGMISRGGQKTMEFLEETIEPYGLPNEEWNFVNVGSSFMC